MRRMSGPPAPRVLTLRNRNRLGRPGLPLSEVQSPCPAGRDTCACPPGSWLPARGAADFVWQSAGERRGDIVTVGIASPASSHTQGAPACGRKEYPPRPTPKTWPETEQPRAAVVERLCNPPFRSDSADVRRCLRRGLTALLDWLEQQPGRTWQERWVASGAETQGAAWTDLLCGLFWRDLEQHHPASPRCAWTPSSPPPGRTGSDKRPGRAPDRQPGHRPQPAADRPGVLPRHRPVGRRGPVTVGRIHGTMSGQGQRMLHGQRAQAPQGRHGPADPRAPSGPARAGAHGRPLAQGHPRPARCRATRRAGPGLRGLRPEAAAQTCGRGPDLCHRPGRSATRSDLRGRTRLLGLGDHRCSPSHRMPHRGAGGTLPPQLRCLQTPQHGRQQAEAASRGGSPCWW